uniref:Cation/H+ exchanger domain-containing protein n=1 Tax=Kalanchoe fedtschenkoi TaxID=63787 RepID=A0A7N0ZTH4_KALFE
MKVQVEAALVHHVYDPGPPICGIAHGAHSYSGIFYQKNPLDYSFTLMLLEISTVIIISRIVRILLKPLKQPRVVSDAIGGIIFGPSVLARSKGFAETMLPDNAVFIIKNIGMIGLMYFLFMTGVKMDLTMMKKTGRKHLVIALSGVIIPMLMVIIVAAAFRTSLDKEIWKVSSMGTISSSFAITAFPVLYPILREMNLLSSEMGRMALSTSIISDVIGINFVVAFEAALQGETRSIDALWYVISVVGILAFMLFCVRKFMEWIIEQTPDGKAVDQTYIILILMGVLGMGFVTDMFGVAVLNGPLWFGLAIPDGPPLGSTLVERSEVIIMEILMPFSFAFLGLYTDVFTLNDSWPTLKPLMLMAFTGYVTKLVVTIAAALYFETPLEDSLALGLILSLRGQVEFIMLMHWMDKSIIKVPAFTLMMLLTIMVTGVATPLISIVYDPTKPYMINKRRTIQHTPPNTQLHVVACIHDQESVSGIINLIEVSNPTESSPFIVYALHLIELVGRATPVFIDHRKEDNGSNFLDNNRIHHALKMYEESRQGLVKIHPFTAVSPQRSMYQDICELSLTSKATLIILPFHKECLNTHGGAELVRRGVRTLNSNVLAHAPCSVGILVEKAPLHNPLLSAAANIGSSSRQFTHNFAVLFLGGADAREALSYADRMTGNPDVSLTVVRFLSHNYIGEDEMEKKLDDGLVTWFWVKNEGREHVVYREVVVKNGEETVAAIQAMNDNSYNLWIMGRRQGINPVLLEGLTDWNENHELGVIGDHVASMDFGGLASVLVLQQQVLREQRRETRTVKSVLQRLPCK